MLKRMILATVLISTIATQIFGQSSDRDKDKDDKMEYSIVGGINFGYFNAVPPINDAVSSFGYMIGIDGNLGKNVFFEPGVQFASYGSTITLGGVDGVDHKMRSNYIRIPAEVGLKLFNDADINAEIRGGLSESLLVGFTDDPSNGSPLLRHDISDTRTAGIVGGGVRLLFLKLDLEYEWGLTNFFANNGDSKLSALYIVLGGNF
jgi:hypothetical protein